MSLRLECIEAAACSELPMCEFCAAAGLCGLPSEKLCQPEFMRFMEREPVWWKLWFSGGVTASMLNCVRTSRVPALHICLPSQAFMSEASVAGA